MSEWRDGRNQLARARLERSLPALFPAPVLGHALAKPLIPPTPRRAIESYWRAHPLRADRLARGLARLSEAPAGWSWQLATDPDTGRRASFRTPPAPFRENAYSQGPGFCVACGQPAFRYGWHRDLWSDGKPNGRTRWHAACVVAWSLWRQPAEHVAALKRQQKRRCALTGKRLLKSAEVDHAVPLYSVWRRRETLNWPALLDHWGAPNLRVIAREAHAAKTVGEAGARSRARAVLLNLAGGSPS